MSIKLNCLLLVVLSLALMQVESTNLDSGFSYQSFTKEGESSFTDNDDGSDSVLYNFVYSQTVDGAAISKVWDMTITNLDVATFLAMDTNGTGYIGQVNLQDGGADLKKVDDGYIKTIIGVSDNHIFAWLQDGTAALYDGDRDFDKKWITKVTDETIIKTDTMADVALLEDDKGDFWVFGTGFALQFSSSGSLEFSMSFDFDGYTFVNFNSAVEYTTDNFMILGVATSTANLDVTFDEESETFTDSFSSVLLHINKEAKSIRGYVYKFGDGVSSTVLPDVRVVLNKLVKISETEVTVIGSYEYMDKVYYLWAHMDPHSFFGTVGDLLFFRSNEEIGGPVVATSFYTSGDNEDPNDNTTAYSIAGNGFVTRKNTVRNMYTTASMANGCYMFYPTTIAAYGSGDFVLMGGYLSGDDGALMFMAWDKTSAMRNSFGVSMSGSLSSTHLRVYGATMPTLELKDMTTTSSSPANLSVTNMTLKGADNNMATLVAQTQLPSVSQADAEITFDDDTFSFDINKLTVTIKSPSNVTYSSDTMKPADDATEPSFDVSYWVTYTDTYQCLATSLVLPNTVSSGTYAVFANGGKFDTLMTTINGVANSAAGTASHFAIDVSGTSYVFVQSQSMSEKPVAKYQFSPTDGQLYFVNPVPETIGDYIFVTGEHTLARNDVYSTNKWGKTAPDGDKLVLIIPPGQSSMGYVGLENHGGIDFYELDLKTGAFSENHRFNNIPLVQWWGTIRVGDIITILYENTGNSPKPKTYIMAISVESGKEKVLFNKAFTLEGLTGVEGDRINRALLFAQGNNYIVTGSYGDYLGFIIQLDNNGDVADSKAFKTETPLLASLNIGYYETLRQDTTTGAYNSSKKEAILTLNTEGGIMHYFFKVDDITADSDDIQLDTKNKDNISITAVSMMGVSSGVTCMAYLMDTTGDDYIIGSGVCAASFDVQGYMDDKAVKSTPFFFKISSTGQYEQNHSTSNVIFYSAAAKVPHYEEIPVGTVSVDGPEYEPLDSDTDGEESLFNDLDSALIPTVTAGGFYTSPNLVGSTLPTPHALESTKGDAEDTFSYNVSSNFYGLDSYDNCSWELSTGSKTNACYDVQVDWDVVNVLEKKSDSDDGIETRSNDKLPCLAKKVRIPMLAQCYGFYQETVSYELEVEGGISDDDTSGSSSSSAGSKSSAATVGTIFTAVFTAMFALWM